MGWLSNLLGRREPPARRAPASLVDLTVAAPSPADEAALTYRLLAEEDGAFEPTGEAFKARPSEVDAILDRLREANGRCYGAEAIGPEDVQPT